jgi:hypothetical protein
MDIVESWCCVVRCCLLTVLLLLNLASVCVRFMVIEQKQISFSRSHQISLSFLESSIFPCSCVTSSSGVWQQWLGSTLSPPQTLSFVLHLLMTLGYLHTSLLGFLIYNHVAPEYILEYFNKLPFLYYHYVLPATSQWYSLWLFPVLRKILQWWTSAWCNVYNTVQFCAEACTTPAYMHKESGFVIYVYNMIQFCLEAYTAQPNCKWKHD